MGMFLILISLNLVSSLDAESSSYSVGSFHTGVTGGDSSSSSYSSDFSLTYQQPVGSANSSSFTVFTGFFSQPEFCGDGTCNNDEDCSSCPEDCGACPTTPSSDTTSGGGGGTACTYDWVCSEWYPEPCPAEGIQKRVCVNKGTCSGTDEMPETTRNCIPVVIPPSEPLFDLFVNVPLKYKYILRDGDVIFDVELINMGNKTTIDIFLKYWIVDESGKLITEKRETRAIGEKEKFRNIVSIPDNLEEGIYKIHVQIEYDEGKIAVAGDSFEIVDSEFNILLKKTFSFPFILIPLSIPIIIFLLLLIKRKKRKKPLKKRRKKKTKKISKKKKRKKSTKDKKIKPEKRARRKSLREKAKKKAKKSRKKIRENIESSRKKRLYRKKREKIIKKKLKEAEKEERMREKMKKNLKKKGKKTKKSSKRKKKEPKKQSKKTKNNILDYKEQIEKLRKKSVREELESKSPQKKKE